MLTAATLSKLPGVRHGFFTRAGGVSSGVYATLNGGTGSKDAPDKIAENRARMAAALGVKPTHLVSAHQIHSPDVVVADEPWTQQARPRADAIVTRKPQLAVGVSTADCGPLLFADSEACVIGAAHAGWRGALTGVIEATVSAMEQLGAKRTRIAAALGPTIRQPNYEVGPEFIARFVAADHLRLRVGEQHWSAIRRRYAESDARHFRHHGIDARSVVARPRLLDHDDIGRVDLIGGEEMLRLDAERLRHPAAVFVDVVGVIFRADAAIERRVNALRHAAGAREERVANAVERRE